MGVWGQWPKYVVDVVDAPPPGKARPCFFFIDSAHFVVVAVNLYVKIQTKVHFRNVLF